MRGTPQHRIVASGGYYRGQRLSMSVVVSCLCSWFVPHLSTYMVARSRDLSSLPSLCGWSTPATRRRREVLIPRWPPAPPRAPNE